MTHPSTSKAFDKLMDEYEKPRLLLLDIVEIPICAVVISLPDRMEEQ